MNMSFLAQVWFPIVITSTSSSNMSSKFFCVIPIPSAAFSPLTMTKSMFSSFFIFPNLLFNSFTPVFPIKSPIAKIFIFNHNPSLGTNYALLFVSYNIFYFCASLYKRFGHSKKSDLWFCLLKYQSLVFFFSFF